MCCSPGMAFNQDKFSFACGWRCHLRPMNLSPPWTCCFISLTVPIIHPFCVRKLKVPFSVFKLNLKATFFHMLRFIIDDTSQHCKMTESQIIVLLVINAPRTLLVFLGHLLQSRLHRTWSPVYRLITFVQIMPQPAPCEAQASACPAAPG